MDDALFTHRQTVAFQDADAAGIVFYARIFNYFHDGYVAFLRTRGAPLEDALDDGSWIAPIRKAEAEYRRPLRFGDEIEIAITGVEIAETEYRIAYRIATADGIACEGATTHVSVDPNTFRRCPVPPGLRAALVR
jgi:1,4-dihydroxy-2-naphthoyl-CoA hydrolase